MLVQLRPAPKWPRPPGFRVDVAAAELVEHTAEFAAALQESSQFRRVSLALVLGEAVEVGAEGSSLQDLEVRREGRRLLLPEVERRDRDDPRVLYLGERRRPARPLAELLERRLDRRGLDACRRWRPLAADDELDVVARRGAGALLVDSDVGAPRLSKSMSQEVRK